MSNLKTKNKILLKKKKKNKEIKVSAFEIKFAKMTFNSSFRISFYEKLENGIKNGVKIYDVIKNLEERYGQKNKKDPKAIAMWHMRKEMDEHSSLSRSLKGWAKSEEVAIIDAGETSGDLINALSLSRNIIENNKKMVGTLIKALTYPAILVTVAIFVLFFLGTYVIPQITESVGNAEAWTGAAGSLYKTSLFVQSEKFFISIGIFFGVMFFIFNTMTSSWFGSGIRKYFDKFPPWSIYREMQGSAFIISLSSMLKAGIKIHDSLIRIAKNSSSWTRHRIGSIIMAQKSGHSGLGDAMLESNQGFPDKETIEDIRFYQSLGNLDEILEQIGQQNMKRTLSNLEKISGRISAISMLIIIGMVVWIVIGVMSIQDQITTQMAF
jgi:type II secretory pathway component PulF